MNKISFRELIDLEPKPKKVKYENNIYDYNLNYYSCKSCTLEELLDMRMMKEPNIEIIEEDKQLEIYSDFSSTQNGMTKSDREKLDNNFRTIDLILKDLINKKEGK